MRTAEPADLTERNRSPQLSLGGLHDITGFVTEDRRGNRTVAGLRARFPRNLGHFCHPPLPAPPSGRTTNMETTAAPQNGPSAAITTEATVADSGNKRKSNLALQTQLTSTESGHAQTRFKGPPRDESAWPDRGRGLRGKQTLLRGSPWPAGKAGTASTLSECVMFHPGN